MALADKAPSAGTARIGPMMRLALLWAQAEETLGRRGSTALATAAIMGFVCCLVSLVGIALVLGSTGDTRQREHGAAIRSLELAHRDLMRVVVATATGTLERQEGEQPAIAAFRRFEAQLANVCRADRLLEDYADVLPPFCSRFQPDLARLAGHVAGHDPPARRMSREAMREFVVLRDELAELSRLVARRDDEHAERLAVEAWMSSLMLAVSTTGFALSGVMLFLMLGRMLVAQAQQSDKVRHSADLLGETLETLSAGVVVYDREGRLLMFNSAARELTPALQQPNAIGRTYAELAIATADDLKARGMGDQPVDEWIARFNGHSRHRTRQALDGRWIDWSEQRTPSGLTVGLRVDVTEIKAHEVELKRERAKYESLINSLTDAVCVVDLRGTVTYVSPAISTLLGVPPDEVVGTPFLKWVVPQDAERALKAGDVFARLPNEEMRQIQVRMRAADSAIRHVEVRYRRAVGSGSSLVGVIRDVTERVELERMLDDKLEELARARAEYESLVDSLSDVAYTLDVEKGVYTFISAAGEKFFGKPASEIVGHHFLEFVAPQSRDQVERSTTREYRADDPGTHASFCLIGAGGEVRTVEVRSRRRIENGRLLSSGIIRDIEDRVRLEQRLELERSRLRSIVESSGAMIVLVDSSLNIVMANGGFEALAGLSADLAVGRPLREIVDCPPELKAGGNAGQATTFAAKLSDLSGRERLVSFTATPVAGGDGQSGGRPASWVLIGVDDTERRDAEQALFDTERFATVGEMAGTMAHEISQPLQVINIACTSARDELSLALEEGGTIDGPYLDKKLARIAQQVEGASRIVDDLRAFVRGSADKQPGAFDPGKAIASAVDLTAHGVRQAGASLKIEIAPNLPHVVGDVGRLEQVLVNLINNARDAGGRAIDIVADPVGAAIGPAYVRIRVEDSGHGIDAAVLERLFVSFVTTKPRGKGTGLGLRICRRIIEEMGGTITAANRPQGGARLEILLPVVPAMEPSQSALAL